MSTLPTLLIGKEQNYQPALLAQFQFQDGSTLRCCTHNLSSAEGGNQYQGNDYLARIDDQDIAQVQARSEQGIDRFGDVTIRLSNADQYILLNYEFNATRGFKGAILQLALVLMDIDPATGEYFFNSDSQTPFKFTGICDAPSQAPGGGQYLSIRATTSHNMAMTQLPVELIQQRCINSFPINAARRLAGATDMSAIEWGCGYNPDQAGTDPEIGGDCRRGNTGTPGQTDSYGNVIADSAGIFNVCDYTKATCVMFGMYKADSASRPTARFKAIQWMPNWEETQSNSYVNGKNITVFAMRNAGIYALAYPLVYGTQWVNNPVIANVIGDGNSTRMEIVVANGDVGPNGIQQVVVNGVLIPAWGVNSGFNPGDPLERWNFLDNPNTPSNSTHTGGRNGYSSLDAEYNGTGDPYGGLATIEVVVYADLAQSNSTPSVQVLTNGTRVTKYQPIVSYVNGLITFPAGFVNVDLAGNPPFTVQVVGNTLAGANGTFGITWTTGPPYTITLTGGPSGSGTGGFVRYLAYASVEGLTSPAGNTYSSFGQNPAWVIFDLLIWANYSYAEIDVQSFVAAAAFCDVNVNYTDLNGNAASHPRFIFQTAYTAQAKANSILQAALRSFNAQLVPNSDTGLLQLFIRQTLADQQPSPIPGSNYNVAIASPTALNVVSQGYVAYLIDESIVLQDDKGAPMLNGPYALPNAQTPNNLVIGFQDADNQWVLDSVSMTDPDDVARSSGYQLGGAAIPAGYAVTGISSFDQGGRIANVILAENFRGNPYGSQEITGTRGSYFWQPTTTHRVEHLRVGDIVLFRSQAQQLAPFIPLQSPPGTGITGILCRVEAIKPASNYERMGLTLKWHEDEWYTDVFGQTGTPGYSSPIGTLPSRPPLPWKPYGQQPIAGDSMYASSEWNFAVAASYIAAANGDPIPQLTISGCFPVNVLSKLVQPPNMLVQANTASTGGTIPGGLRLNMAISAQDSAGNWSALSKFTSVSIPSATNTNTATTPTINWDPATVNWVLFGGTGHHSLCEQMSGSGTPSTITITNPNTATYGPPDQVAGSIILEVKREIHGGVWGDTCTAVASLGGGSGTLTFVEGIPANGTFAQIDATHGYDLTQLANPIGSTAAIPIADFHVVNNVGGVYTVTPDPTAGATPITAGCVFEMRALPTIITATTIGDTNFVNAYATNGFGVAGNEEVGHRLRIVKGTGRGQERNIVGNNNDSLTIDRPWDTTPDNTSRFIVEEAAWQDLPYAVQSAGVMTPSPVPSVGVITVANYALETVLVRAVICDATGNASSKRYSPIREVYIEGAQGTRIVGASTTMLSTDGLVTFFGITANATYTCLPFASVPNQRFTISRQSCGAFTVTINVLGGSGDDFPGGGTTIVLTDDTVNYQTTWVVPA
jgi:hypothetical protein